MVLDKFEQIATYADYVVCILGNPLTSDFELVDMSVDLGVSMPEAAILSARQRGLYFVGVAGLAQGVPQTALAVPLDAATITALAAAYIRHIETKMKEALEIAALAQLHQLADARPIYH